MVRPSPTAALTFAVALTAAPALAGETDSLSPGRQPTPGQAPAPQAVTSRELGQYMQALWAIARWQPDVAATLERGDTMDRALLDKASWRQKLRGLRDVRQAGLTGERFLDIAQRISSEAPLRQRYFGQLGALVARAPGERGSRP